VDTQPDAEALVSRGERVTYRQLWERVGRVVAFLRTCGVAEGDRVALLIGSSPEYVACYYGTLAAGAVAVPLNHESKARDLAGWSRHSGARLIIADRAHPERTKLANEVGESVPVFVVSDALAAAPVMPDIDVEALLGGDRLAMLLYTSGTTGEPKGVMLSHRNLTTNVLAVVEYLRLTPTDRVLSALPFFYSYGNSVLHTHLAAGATVVIEPSMMYPQRTVELMRDESVTGFSGVPWMFTLLLSRTKFGAMQDELSALRYCTQAGAPMAPAEIRRVTSAYPHVEFFVMYGQTEATARLTYLPPFEAGRRSGSVGIAIPGLTIEVRRPDQSNAAVGESGEVFACGPNVMLGYWNAPELSRAAIHEDQRGRWLRTGDVGYLDADGFLYLAGRNSEIIKTGAHRVSPLEIEEVVLGLDGVAEAAAFGVPDEQLGEAIQVAVVRQPGAELTERDVLAHCRGQLSLFKMPQRIVFRPSLPRTTQGKIQRRALAEVVGMETGETRTWTR
jgi:acyl-CoA synthetase (AMP-forming)/AMP-acid ligase II